jgi:hypothetical protein
VCCVLESVQRGLDIFRLVLLRHNAAGGLDPVPVDHTGFSFANERDDGFVVRGGERFFWQLEPGAEAVCGAELPECYYRAMRAGETYTLLYPGHEILTWDWGTLKELTGREIKKRAPAATTEGSPNPVVPGGRRSPSRPWRRTSRGLTERRVWRR